jgi:pyruvate dehydrogenase E1 component alpha subunit
VAHHAELGTVMPYVERTDDIEVVPLGLLGTGRLGAERDADTVTPWTVERLRAFEVTVRDAIEGGRVKGPVHLSGGNESPLIELFRYVDPGDWCFSTYRAHYHALLHGLPEQYVLHEILAGRSISLHSAEHRFFTSAIVGGCLPIALGVAAAVKRVGDDTHVWCFVGDMAASCGTYKDCLRYAESQDLPISFVIENDGFSTYTPTEAAWGMPVAYPPSRKQWYYRYERTEPHIGARADATL